MRCQVVAALCVLAACSKSPSAPSSPPAGAPVPPPGQYGGFWSIDYRVSTCQGGRQCAFLRGSTKTVDLRLQQQGLAVRGVFAAADTVSDVSGTVQPDGSVTLTGSDTTQVPKQGRAPTARVELRFAPDGALQGTLVYDITPLPEYAEFYEVLSLGGDVVGVERSDLGAFVSDLNGKWSGKFIVRSCTPPRGGYCHPVSDQGTEYLDLTLTRISSDVSGTFDQAGTRIPVTGSATGWTLKLSGELLRPANAGATVIRVSGWNTTIDEFGRMKGTFNYEYQPPTAADGSVATAELWQMVKRR